MWMCLHTNFAHARRPGCRFVFLAGKVSCARDLCEAVAWAVCISGVRALQSILFPIYTPSGGALLLLNKQ